MKKLSNTINNSPTNTISIMNSGGDTNSSNWDEEEVDENESLSPIDLPPHSLTDEEIHQFLEDLGVNQLGSEESTQPQGANTEYGRDRSERISSFVQLFASRVNAPVDSPAVAYLKYLLSSFTSDDALEKSFKLIQSNMAANAWLCPQEGARQHSDNYRNNIPVQGKSNQHKRGISQACRICGKPKVNHYCCLPTSKEQVVELHHGEKFRLFMLNDDKNILASSVREGCDLLDAEASRRPLPSKRARISSEGGSSVTAAAAENRKRGNCCGKCGFLRQPPGKRQHECLIPKGSFTRVGSDGRTILLAVPVDNCSKATETKSINSGKKLAVENKGDTANDDSEDDRKPAAVVAKEGGGCRPKDVQCENQNDRDPDDHSDDDAGCSNGQFSNVARYPA